LYDYVERIRDSVNDDGSITIDGRLITFLKANRDEFLPVLNKQESEELREEMDKFIEDFRRKILPSIIKRKPRIIFRKKRLEIILREPVEQYIIDKDKIKIDIPMQEQLDFFDTTIIPMSYLMNEFSELENKIKERED